MFVFLITGIYSQTITYDDFKGLIPYLRAEKWKSAYKESSKLLKSADKDTSDLKGIVVYINIFSAAGMVSEGKMSYKDLEEKVMPFQGQKVVMPGHPLSSRPGSLNTLSFSISDSTNTAFTSSTNHLGTNILCFEKFYLKEKINPDDFKNAMVRCGGILEKIELNPNQSLIWIMRLTVTDAFARKAN
jgi:hypothetical protein